MRTRHSIQGVLFAWAFSASTVSGPAYAQVCHAGGADAGDGFVASLHLREATVRDGATKADYQGALLGASYGLRPVELSVLFPAYRLDGRTGVRTGVGDVLLDVRLSLWSGLPLHHHGDRIQTGVELAATLPTGDRDKGLSMGHVMAMPGLFLRASDHGVGVLVQVGYGRALVAGGHSGHAGHAGHAGHVGHPEHGDPFAARAAAGSIVDPMSDSEIETAVTLSANVTDHFGLDAVVAAAAPVAAEVGAARGAAGLGMHARFGAVTPSVMIELPWIGAPFTHRFTLAVAVAP